MVKVLKEGKRTEVTCEHCESILSYTAVDIMHNGSTSFIKCPVCENNITVSKPHIKENA